MKKQLIGFYFLLLTSVAASVQAGAGSAVLTAYIQNGTVTNTSGPGVTMTEVFYTLGPAGDNVATWDGSVGGGTAEDLLSNPQFFQSVRWSGLNVAPGSTFNFSGIDIDLIETLDPLSVTGATLDETGESLRGAYIRATFSDGSTACAPPGSASLVRAAGSGPDRCQLQLGCLPERSGSCGRTHPDSDARGIWADAAGTDAGMDRVPASRRRVSRS